MHAQIQQFIITMSIGSVALRLLLAALFGFVIGLDRELRSQSAGLRSYFVRDYADYGFPDHRRPDHEDVSGHYAVDHVWEYNSCPGILGH